MSDVITLSLHASLQKTSGASNFIYNRSKFYSLYRKDKGNPNCNIRDGPLLDPHTVSFSSF